MINSRDPSDLSDNMFNKWKMFHEDCVKQSIDVILTSTYRDFESQDALYAQGRTAPGKRVTNARGGDSYHNYRMAFDVVPIVAGKAVWSDLALWKRVGAIGKQCGLEWGGDFKSLKDYPHFQCSNGLTIAQLKSMYPKGVP